MLLPPRGTAGSLLPEVGCAPERSRVEDRWAGSRAARSLRAGSAAVVPVSERGRPNGGTSKECCGLSLLRHTTTDNGVATPWSKIFSTSRAIIRSVRQRSYSICLNVAGRRRARGGDAPPGHRLGWSELSRNVGCPVHKRHQRWRIRFFLMKTVDARASSTSCWCS